MRTSTETATNFEEIPHKLRRRAQWVNWRAEERRKADGSCYTTKVPYQPNGRKAIVNDLATWSTFEKVCAAYRRGEFDGIGFCFSSADPFAGIDLDNCRDPETGEVEEWARKTYARLDSYTEVSPSGTGLHVVVEGKLPGRGRKRGNIEMYYQDRYFTFTGDVLDSGHARVHSRQEELSDLYERAFGEKAGSEAGDESSSSQQGLSGPTDLGDHALIEKAKAAEDGGKFERLWSGDLSGYPSPSEADLALCLKLAFWTGGDVGRVDALFRQSGLMREKWDARRGAETYGTRTVRKALELATEFYEPDGHVRNGAQGAIHDSRPLRDREIVNGEATGRWSGASRLGTANLSFTMENNEEGSAMDGEFARLWGFEKPAPRRWYVPGLIPEGDITILAGDGGTGKSLLAVLLSLCVALGRPFLNLGTLLSSVLFVDFELDLEEQQRRVWRVAQGMGVSVHDERLAGRLFYLRPGATLCSVAAHEEIARKVARHGVDLVILDSLTVGAIGDATSAEDVVNVLQHVRQWGATVLAIDHLSHAGARGNASEARPYGSVFKRNLARSLLTLTKTEAGGYRIHQGKTNFDAPSDGLCYAVEFDGRDGAITFERIDESDDRMAGALKHLPTHDQTLVAIKSIYRETKMPATLDEIVEWREEHGIGISLGTVRNHLTELSRREKIERDEDGRAMPASTSFTIHDSIETVKP